MSETKQLDVAIDIINNYAPDQPFASYLNQFFRKNKQMGSSDRRLYAELCYAAFRTGKAIPSSSIREKICIGYFLINTVPNLFFEVIAAELNSQIEKSIEEKIEIVNLRYPEFNAEKIYSFKAKFSEGVNAKNFSISHLIKPLVFLRVNERNSERLLKRFDEENISYQSIFKTTISVEPATQLQQFSAEGIHFEVQDLSSQHVSTFFEPKPNERWWDCCAGSGGKTLLINSIEPLLKLLVSDMRATILENLKERFLLAGITKYQLKEIDLAKNFDAQLPGYEFDGIILDAPCSGSGTWGRTPELLTYFDEEKLKLYISLQYTFAKNVSKYLLKGKPLIYITCSVFKSENEDMVEKIARDFNYTIDRSELIKGYDKRADSMFAARLIKN